MLYMMSCNFKREWNSAYCKYIRFRLQKMGLQTRHKLKLKKPKSDLQGASKILCKPMKWV